MSVLTEPNAEPIPGYRLLEPLGRGGFGEVWKCEAPGGLFKAIKFVEGPAGLDDATSAADEEWRAIERIKSIRHPFLVSMERVERLGGRLLIVMELADSNLDKVLRQRQRAGAAGIPRDELLGYLAEAAEVLDLMNARHGLQHLDVKPKNLFLVSNHVKVADFGLVSGLGRFRAGESPLGAVTPLYCSPEVFAGSISPHSDQYSLAAVYHELLTGAVPFAGKNARQLMLQHTRDAPDLGRLPPADRPVVARALAKVPGERFASCLEFVRALQGGRPARSDRISAVGDSPDRINAVTTSAGPGGSESLPGFRLARCLERGPLSEVWQAEGPDGRPRQVKYVYGFDQGAWKVQQEAVARLRELRHPALARTDVLLNGPGRLALVGDVPGPSLRDRWQECRAEDGSGIPRTELLHHLRQAAEALDALFEQFGLLHLAICPRSLRLEGGRLVVADFGLVPLFWLPAGRSMAQINPRHAAPELFERQVTRSADQYSLALVYHEMLTGSLPPRGRGRSMLPLARPGLDLGLLGPADRDVLARALHDEPPRRFASCGEFINALMG
ncbi:MAG TPA: protein kinase [Gemmataceae bacterium]|nr:protein kinase [Gemmataceae bacterium]